MCKDLGLYVNDQLIILTKEMDELKKKNMERHDETFDKRCKDIMEKKDISKLFNIKTKKKEKEELAILQVNINKAISSTKLTFDSKFYNGGKKKEYPEIISPLMVYNMTNELLGEYLQDVDEREINKEKFDQSIIHLLYFIKILSEKFKKESKDKDNSLNLCKFLIYCLDQNK